jgi:hypothetical protein
MHSAAMLGACLFVDDQAVHLELFPELKSQR